MASYVSKKKVGAVALASVAVMAFCWFLASVCDPSWEIGKESLSTLGVSSVESAAAIFNYGVCILGGALVAITGMLYLLSEKSKKMYVVMGVLTAVIGALIFCSGICPNDKSSDLTVYHNWFAFSCAYIAIVLYVLYTYEAWVGKKYFDAIILTAGLFATAVFYLMGTFYAQAIGIAFFFAMLTLFGVGCFSEKKEKKASLYTNEVDI